MRALAHTQAIRAGAHGFAAEGQEMRESGYRVQMKAHSLVQGSDGWHGEGADAFLSVAEHLRADATLAGEAFGRASGALMSLAGQLDEVNSLRQQAEHVDMQMNQLQRELWGADEAQQASIHQQLSHLRHQHSTLSHQADSLEYQANANASATFDEIGAWVNRLSFQQGSGQTAAASAMDKVGHFFGTLWKGAKGAAHKVEEAVEETFDEFDDLLQDGIDTVEDSISGLAKGIGQSLLDTVEGVWELSPAHFVVQLVTNFDEVRSKAERIFQDLEHPVDAIERNLSALPEQAAVIRNSIVDSWNRDIVSGNAYTRSKWVGYALGMVAQGVLTDGAGTLAGAEAKVVGVETKVVQVADDMQGISTQWVERKLENRFSRDKVKGESFEQQAPMLLEAHGMEIDKFNKLRLKPTHELVHSEAIAMRGIREDIPMPEVDCVIQKVIPGKSIPAYLEGKAEWAQQIGGFVSKAHDVNHLTTPQDCFVNLALNYEGTLFSIEDDVIGVLKWKNRPQDEFKIPFGGQTDEGVRKMGGYLMQKDPFMGNGFTKSQEYLIPEYQIAKKFPIPDGTELYAMSRDGQEKLVAIYDSIDGRFVNVEE